MGALEIAALILGIIGKAADLGKLILSTATADAEEAATALQVADAALSTAIISLEATLKSNNAQIDAERAAKS